MKTYIASILLISIIVLSSCRNDDDSEIQNFEVGLSQDLTLSIDGIERAYDVYLPTSYAPNMPAVIDLHGFSLDKEKQREISGFDLLAEKEGFIAIFPQGLVGSTDLGTDNYWNANFDNTVDDIGFLNVLIDHLYEDHKIDLDRVYFTGFSNGGFMSYTLACEIGDRIAAIASVTGSMRFSQIADCDPGKSMPILQIHGTNDPIVPYSWNDAVIDFWLSNNNCNETSVDEVFDNLITTDGSTAERSSWTDCDGKSTFDLITIQNGGHTWPGSQAFIAAGVGGTNKDINASQLIWEFLSQYTR